MRDVDEELVIFDVTDPVFYPGRVSSMFNDHSDDCNAVWFFQPASWVPAEGANWYGGISNTLTKTLMCYSTGHPTRDAAVTAAAEWKATAQARAIRWKVEEELCGAVTIEL